MHDILIPTSNHILLHNFLTTPSPEIFEGCRIWVVQDDRVIDRDNINGHNLEIHEHWLQRQMSFPENIQAVITSAIGRGVPVYPYAISGSAIIGHYSNKWDLFNPYISQLWNYPMSVKILAVSALQEFYGVERVLALDDDTLFFNPAWTLFEPNGMAMASCDSLTPIDSFRHGADVTFQRLSVIAGFQHGALQPRAAMKAYNELGYIGCTILMDRISEYTENWKMVFTDKLIIEDTKSKVKRYLSQNLVGIMSMIHGAHIYDCQQDGEVFTKYGVSNKKRIYLDWENLTLFHYLPNQMGKSQFAYWLHRAVRGETKSSGRRFLESKNDRWIEGIEDWAGGLNVANRD